MIEERVSKQHGLRFYVRVDWRGKRYAIGTYPTMAKAKKAEREARNAIDRGTFIPPADAKKQEKPEPERIPTVADALAIYLDTKRTTVAANTMHNYEAAVRLHVNPALGDRDIRTLRHDDIQQVVNRWRDSGMGGRLIGRCVVLIRAALDRQVRNGTIPYNVAVGVEKPSERRQKEITIWTNEELDRFLVVALRDEQHAPLWAFCLLEGMRRGEALGLRWSDLRWSTDESECIATINQTNVQDVGNGGGSLIQNRAKTNSSRRSIQLTESTIQVLKAHQDRQRFQRQQLHDLWPNTDLILTTGIGTPITPTNAHRYLDAITRQARIPRTTVHGLRHLNATLALRSGVSATLVSAKLGHANVAVTTGVYGHLAVTDQAAVNVAIDAMVRKTG